MAHFIIFQGIPGNYIKIKTMLAKLHNDKHTVYYVTDDPTPGEFFGEISLPQRAADAMRIVKPENMHATIQAIHKAHEINSTIVLVYPENDKEKFASFSTSQYTHFAVTTEPNYLDRIIDESDRRRVLTEDKLTAPTQDDIVQKTLASIDTMIAELKLSINASCFFSGSLENQKLFLEAVRNNYKTVRRTFASDEEKLKHVLKVALEVFMKNENCFSYIGCFSISHPYPQYEQLMAMLTPTETSALLPKNRSNIA